MRSFFVMTAGELADALENWMIDNKCNPSTPEEWAKCMEDIAAQGRAKYLGSTSDEDASIIKKELLDSGVQEIKKISDEDSNENS